MRKMRTSRTNHDQVSWRWRAIIGREDNTITAWVVQAKKDLVTLAVQSVACDTENREAKQLLALTLTSGRATVDQLMLITSQEVLYNSFLRVSSAEHVHFNLCWYYSCFYILSVPILMKIKCVERYNDEYKYKRLGTSLLLPFCLWR